MNSAWRPWQQSGPVGGAGTQHRRPLHEVPSRGLPHALAVSNAGLVERGQINIEIRTSCSSVSAARRRLRRAAMAGSSTKSGRPGFKRFKAGRVPVNRSCAEEGPIATSRQDGTSFETPLRHPSRQVCSWHWFQDGAAACRITSCQLFLQDSFCHKQSAKLQSASLFSTPLRPTWSTNSQQAEH